MSLEIVPIPVEETNDEDKIRDIKDRPILRAALKENVDVLLTGDKDFLESKIDKPLMLMPSEFLKLK